MKTKTSTTSRHPEEIRVAVFDDSEERRLSLKYLIEMHEGLQLVGSFENAINAVEQVGQCRPDVVLMDVEMPEISGIEAVRKIKESYPGVVILMQTIFDEEHIIFEAIKAGASGYLIKKSAPATIIDGIREAKAGGSPISPSIAAKVLAFFREQGESASKGSGEIAPAKKKNNYGLTDREKEILNSLVEGNSYKMVAAALEISYHTVNTHVRHIYEKLHVHSLGEAVAKAIKERLV